MESVNKYAGEIGIIAIGPLTNLALAYHLDYSIVDKINVLSIMGGSISSFGIRSFFAAEFNFYLDAESAKIVFETYKNIYVASFDLSFDIGSNKTVNLFTNDAT